MPISFSYVYDFADYRALVRAARRPTWRQVAFRMVALCALTAVMLLVMVPRLRSLDGWIWFYGSRPGALIGLGSLALFFLIARFDYLLSMWLGWFWYRKMTVAGKTVTIVLDEAAVLWSGEAVSGRLEWPAIKRIEAGRDRTFLFIGPLEALIMPRRAFAGEAEYARALDFARARAGA